MPLSVDAWGRCAADYGVHHGHRRADSTIVGASLLANVGLR